MSRHAALIQQLEAAADRLNEQVLAEMYVDPFWRARFGERADKHGRQDGRFHVQYLQQALASDDPAVLEHYARWLQQLLTVRGMCTRHLAEHFDRLGRAIAEEAWPEREAAVALLQAATAALTYPNGVARAVQLRAAAIVDAAAATLAREGADAEHERLRDELDTLVSYCADALALGSPQVLADHVGWLAGFFARTGVPRERLVARLKAIRAALERELPGEQAAIAELLEVALATASAATSAAS